MVKLQQDLIFWRIVHYLTVNRHFRVLTINEMREEVWLEPEDFRNNTIVRLHRYDLDWGNWMRNDAEMVYRKLLDFRKASRMKQIRGYNVYVSSYEPVDDWEHAVNDSQVSKEGNRKISLENVIIEGTNPIIGIERLFNGLGVPVPNMDNWAEGDEYTVEQLIDGVKQASNRKKAEERKLFNYGKPLFTYLLLAVNLVMFAVLELNGGSTSIANLVEYGAKYNPLIMEGEWWRFVTSMFLHIGFLHFFLNSFALFYLGSAIERIFGTKRFIAIYFVAGLLGSFASFAFNSQISAGASGAIYGCFGALLYFGMNYRDLFFRTIGMYVLVILGINLVFGLTVPMVDNPAHLGGLAGGFLASGIVHLPRHGKGVRQIFFFLAALVTASGILFYGFFDNIDPVPSSMIAHELIEMGREEEARSYLQDAFKAAEADVPAETYFLLSQVEYESGQYEDAEANLKIALNKRPQFPEAHYKLALVSLGLGKKQQAVEAAEQAVRQDPGNAEYQNLLKRLKTNIE
ncbi:rhomboid family intramembrane serine protease [Bacillus marinisedimentorum]|uniref:rhomboid family intramembrane serine protease n=1 Tax=Bacillus marinisedimentorum TaxID=1821260 RepID=UPI0007E109A8|nr:rhomboid family intramembrane serine protease [Bacillus marinisedimentorum]